MIKLNLIEDLLDDLRVLKNVFVKYAEDCFYVELELQFFFSEKRMNFFLLFKKE